MERIPTLGGEEVYGEVQVLQEAIVMSTVVWKSDFKDFPGLWLICWLKRHNILERHKNFLVMSVNPYKLLEDYKRYPRFREEMKEYDYGGFIDFLNRTRKEGDYTIYEEELLYKILQRVKNCELDLKDAWHDISTSLAWPKGHINRRETMEALVRKKEEW